MNISNYKEKQKEPEGMRLQILFENFYTFSRKTEAVKREANITNISRTYIKA